MEFCFGVLVSCSWDLLMDVALAMVLCPPFPLRPPLLPEPIKPLWDTCSRPFMIFQGFDQCSLLKVPPGGQRAGAPGRNACPGQSLFSVDSMSSCSFQYPSSSIGAHQAILIHFGSSQVCSNNWARKQLLTMAAIAHCAHYSCGCTSGTWPVTLERATLSVVLEHKIAVWTAAVSPALKGYSRSS